MPDGDSPFLAVPASDWLAANDSAFAIADRFAVSPGHALVIPRRVIATWWEATEAERADILALVDQVKDRLDAELRPDGYNVGFNSGAAAGQTVGHLHIHVIPRYRGDVPDPRGGVRHVIPGKGNYLLPPAEPYALIDGLDRLLRDDLLRCLRDRRFARVDLLVSFVMKSGLDQVHGGLVDALDRGAAVRVLTTDYLTVTDPDALARLLDLAEMRPQAVATRVFHDPATSFHPKAYLFSSADGAATTAFVGSNNLSASGLALAGCLRAAVVRSAQPAADPRPAGGLPPELATGHARNGRSPGAAGHSPGPVAGAAGGADGAGADPAGEVPPRPGGDGDRAGQDVAGRV